jgi:hypothetical protein
MPAGIRFAPDGLVEGQCGLQGGGALTSQIISGNPATVVIQNNRQPGLDWLTVFMTDNNGQERVIGLPDRIRNPRLVTINQVKLLLVRLRSLMRERRQRRSKLADNPLDGAVTGVPSCALD